MVQVWNVGWVALCVLVLGLRRLGALLLLVCGRSFQCFQARAFVCDSINVCLGLLWHSRSLVCGLRGRLLDCMVALLLLVGRRGLEGIHLRIRCTGLCWGALGGCPDRVVVMGRVLRVVVWLEGCPVALADGGPALMQHENVVAAGSGLVGAAGEVGGAKVVHLPVDVGLYTCVACCILHATASTMYLKHRSWELVHHQLCWDGHHENVLVVVHRAVKPARMELREHRRPICISVDCKCEVDGDGYLAVLRDLDGNVGARGGASDRNARVEGAGVALAALHGELWQVCAVGEGGNGAQHGTLQALGHGQVDVVKGCTWAGGGMCTMAVWSHVPCSSVPSMMSSTGSCR